MMLKKIGLLTDLKEFSEYNQEIFTNEVKDADIIWIIAPWSWKNVPKKYLKTKKFYALCITLISINLLVRKKKFL